MRNLMLLLFMMSIVMDAGFAQSDSTPQPHSIRSIFDYDTCAPPCWMGLIPGESTPTDVENVLSEHDDLIGPESVDVVISRLPSGSYDIDSSTKEMRAGGYFFDIGRQANTDSTGSRIEISEGHIDLIVIVAHESISLEQVIERLGQPDIIRLHIDTYNRIMWFMLIYLELEVRLNLTVPTTSCFTSTLLDSTQVDSVLYFSTTAANRIRGSEYSEHDALQSTITSYIFLDERAVALDVWQSWFDDEVDISCKEVWRQLPVPEITPAVEITSEPNVIAASTQEGK